MTSMLVFSICDEKVLYALNFESDINQINHYIGNYDYHLNQPATQATKQIPHFATYLRTFEK